jgi:hypothetical protein
LENYDFLLGKPRPKHNKKKLRFYFLFILVRTTQLRTATKSIQFINKPVFLLSFFPYCCFAFISKQQQQNNRHFIYYLRMLCLGLGENFMYFRRPVAIFGIFSCWTFGPSDHLKNLFDWSYFYILHL